MLKIRVEKTGKCDNCNKKFQYNIRKARKGKYSLPDICLKPYPCFNNYFCERCVELLKEESQKLTDEEYSIVENNLRERIETSMTNYVLKTGYGIAYFSTANMKFEPELIAFYKKHPIYGREK